LDSNAKAPMKISASKPDDNDTKRADTFERLTRQHLDAMWRTAFHMTRDPDTAADLTQEACLRAYSKLDTYETGTNYKAWIFKILTNACRDYMRRENTKPFRVWDSEEVDRAMIRNHCKETLPETHLHENNLYNDAMQAMKLLPPDIRLIVSLSLVEEMTYQEIANAVHVPVGTVKSRLSRGREELQRLLKFYRTDHGTSKKRLTGEKTSVSAADSTVTPLKSRLRVSHD